MDTRFLKASIVTLLASLIVTIGTLMGLRSAGYVAGEAPQALVIVLSIVTLFLIRRAPGRFAAAALVFMLAA